MALGIFAHIKADAAALVPKQKFCQRFGCFCLARTGRTCIKQDTLRAAVRRALQAGHSGDSTFDNIQRFGDGIVLPFHTGFKSRFCIFDFFQLQGLPRIFLDAILIQVDNIAHIPHRNAFIFAKPTQAVDFREAETICQRHKSILNLFQFLRVCGIILFFCLVNIFCKEAGEVCALHQHFPFFSGWIGNSNRFDIGILQIEPCWQVVRLVYDQHQQIF